MMTCRICKMPLMNIAGAANDKGSDRGAIIIPSAEILSQPSSVRRLAMAYRAKNLPRRKILNFVADHLYQHDGELLYLGRNVSFDVDIDEVFGTDRDPSERWLSDFLAFAVDAPRQRAQRRTFDRLVLLWAALAVHNPAQAELVIR